MKYKKINSMLHNFGHSFCSLMNYIEGEYIIDIIPQILKKNDTSQFIIHFPSGKIDGLKHISTKLEKSIHFYSNPLSRHIQSHELEVDKIQDIQMKFSIADSNSSTAAYGFECDMLCQDDRGKSYSIRVNQKS